MGCLFKDVKDLFEYVLPEEANIQAIEEGLDRGLLLFIDKTSIKDVASIDDNLNQIQLHVNFCQFLWTFNYVTFIINDCGAIKDGYVEDEEISKERATELYNEAKRMFANALLMFCPENRADGSGMKADIKLMQTSTNPCNKENRYTGLANDMTITGIVYLLQHEFGHFIKGHEFSTPKTEGEADDHSFRTLIEWGNNNKTEERPLDNTVVIGSMMALMATAFINPTFAGEMHPDIDDRILHLFNTYQSITGKDIYESTLQILISGLCLWAYANKKELPPIKERESKNDYFLRIKEELSLPVKERVKII